MIFSCKSHRNFFQKLPLQCRHFLENPPREKPQNAAAVVNSLRVVFLVRRGNLLSRRTLCGHHFPGNRRHISSQGHGLLNLGGRGGSKKHYGVVSHHVCYRRDIFSTEGSFGFSRISKPRFWGTYVLHSVVSVISGNPAINPLVCGCLSCLRRFRDSRLFVRSTGLQNIGLAKPRLTEDVQRR